MKSLRILTGHHAGVQTQLSKRSQSVGSGENCDIQIIDWKHSAVTVEVNDENKVTILTKTAIANDTNVLNSQTEMPNFIPQRFGDIVLCSGPTADAWPSDISILEKLSWPRLATSSRFSPISLTAGIIFAATLVMISAIANDSVWPAANGKQLPAASLLAQVENVLAESGIDGLTVRKLERGVEITGTVADFDAVNRMRAALAQLDGELVLHRYSIATDIIRAINDAVGVASVQAKYKGAGVFVVTGHTADLDRLLGMMQRIKSDLGSRITQIEVDVTEVTVSKGKRTSAVMATGGIQYVEAADGTKHFSVITPAVDANSKLQSTSVPSSTLSIASN